MSAAPEAEQLKSCDVCQATIYQEHLDRHLAARWAGQLLCPHCLAAKKKTDEDKTDPPPPEADASGQASDALAARGVSGFGTGDVVGQESPPLGRPLNQTGQGATRIRTFHARLSDGAVRHLDQQVNAWLDNHPEVEIKFANTTCGVWEGKHAEPSLILSLFY